jgi:hypothetical protein
VADRYLLESGAPDGYQLEDASGVILLEVPPAASQRFEFWRPLAIVALGLLAVEDYGQPNNQLLHAHRGTSAHGLVPHAYSQLVLVEAEQDARRTDHSQRLLYGKTAAAAPTAGAPWYLWVPPERQLDPEDDARRPDHDNLHLYRVGYQTVGQQQPILNWKSKWPGEDEPYDVKTARPDLHLYRTGFQTVGQSYRIWPKPASAWQDIEPDATREPADLTPFRNTTPAVVTGGAPWYLWAPPIQRLDPEEDARRADHSWLHRYRVGFQTVGQPFQIWLGPQKRLEAEEYTAPQPSAFALTRVTQATATPGQPWYMWPAAKADQTIEPDAQRADQTLLHRYRVGYQTVGQSWAYWIKPQARVEAEEYTVPGPASLAPYRAITIQAQPGQPWFMWPAAKADQSIEPNPVVTNHALALYPFRPHDAVEPPVVVFIDTHDGEPKRRRDSKRWDDDRKQTLRQAIAPTPAPMAAPIEAIPSLYVAKPPEDALTSYNSIDEELVLLVAALEERALEDLLDGLSRIIRSVRPSDLRSRGRRRNRR